MFKFLKKAAARILIVIGFFSLVSTISLIAFVRSQAEKEVVKLPESAVLFVDFANPVNDAPLRDPIAKILHPDDIDVLTLARTIKQAAADTHIKGLVADISFSEISIAKAQEIHQALATFKKAGKFTIAFTDTFSEGDNATRRYYLASQFDEIWMQPSGLLALNGLGIEVPFFKDTLAWAGIKPEFQKRAAYKTGPNQLTETGFTPEHRAELTGLLESYFAQLTAAVKKGRPKVGDVRTLVNNAPFSAKDAVPAGLVDKLGYWQDMENDVRKRLGLPLLEKATTPWRAPAKDVAKDTPSASKKSPLFFAVGEYLGLKQEGLAKQAMSYNDSGNDTARIALIYMHGVIMRNADDDGAGGDGRLILPKDYIEAIQDAIDDKTVGAIVVRIDSGGGSYIASDTIRDALERAKLAGKKVFVSMGDMAASGGYFIALAGDTVVANAGTITGSIGVFGGKLVTQEIAAKAKVKFDSIALGDNALMWSGVTPFTATQSAAFSRSLDDVFTDFKAKVTAARNLKGEALESVVGGRIFTGDAALKVGLIDQVGTLQDTLDLAKVAVGKKAEDAVPLVVLPEEKNPFRAVIDKITGGHFLSALSLVQAFAHAPQVVALRDGLQQAEMAQRGALWVPNRVVE
jgi:protease-4